MDPRRRHALSPTLLDGAMGTELLERDHPPTSLVALPVTDPSEVLEVHSSYPQADAITACTFGLSFSDVDVSQVGSAALALARQVAGRRLVIGCLGPGTRVREASRALADADILLLETFRSLAELERALDVVMHPRVWATLSFADGTTSDGWTPPGVASRLAGRVNAIGANCGDGLQATTKAAIAMVGHGTPVVARPSAGVAQRARPTEFATAARRLWEAGVTYVGGCCGVGSAHLRAAAAVRRTMQTDS